MITMNPEFRRNLWLDITPQRIILTLLLFGLGTAIILGFDRSRADWLGLIGILGFGITAFFMGCRSAANSVPEEVRDGTWDWQRMSAMGPWSMAWGKLLGATAADWFSALIGLCLVFYSTAVRFNLEIAFIHSCFAILTALLAQSVSFATSLVLLQKTQRAKRFQLAASQILGILIGLWAASEGGLFLYSDFAFRVETVVWYNQVYAKLYFVLFSAAAFFFWSFLACYRLMRRELQVASWPWAWPAFTLFTIAYILGFSKCQTLDCGGGGLPYFLPALALAALATYGATFFEFHDIVRLRGLRSALAARRWARVLALLPFWVPALGITILAAVLVLVSLWQVELPDTVRELGVSRELLRYSPLFQVLDRLLSKEVLAAGTLSLLCFMVRDMAIIIAVNLGRPGLRADVAAVLYLVILYGMIPGLLAAFGATTALVAFTPGSLYHPWINLAFGLAEAVLALSILRYRWAGQARRLAASAAQEG